MNIGYLLFGFPFCFLEKIRIEKKMEFDFKLPPESFKTLSVKNLDRWRSLGDEKKINALLIHWVERSDW